MKVKYVFVEKKMLKIKRTAPKIWSYYEVRSLKHFPVFHTGSTKKECIYHTTDGSEIRFIIRRNLVWNLQCRYWLAFVWVFGSETEKYYDSPQPEQV